MEFGRLSPAKEEKFWKKIKEIDSHSRTYISKKNYQHGTTTVYEHSLRVSYESCVFAQKHKLKVNYDELIRAAFLHDYFLYDWHDKNDNHRRPHGFYHPGAALNNARIDFYITEREADIIKHHMFPLTPVPPRCLEGWIVCLMDKVCSTKETLEGKHIVSKKKRVYDYDSLKKDLESIGEKYGGIVKVTSIGKTADSREIYMLQLGSENAEKKILIQASMHGREWLNTQLIMLLVENYLHGYEGGEYYGKKYSVIFADTVFYIIPMANPDGVEISQKGLSGIKSAKIKNDLKNINSNTFRRWKANALGVDINRNFSTGFIKTSESKKKDGEGYHGDYAMAEPETKALVDAVMKTAATYVINFHETGEEIYYKKEGKLLEILAELTHYKKCKEDESVEGCFGDWLTENNIEWCTLETCYGKAPVSHRQLKKLVEVYSSLLFILAEEV